MIKHLCLVLLTTLLALQSSITAAEPGEKTFVFTAIPDQDESQLKERFGKVARYLEQQLGVPVDYIPVKSYAAAVTAFRNGQAHLAWFGGLSGVRARILVPGSEAIAQGAEDPNFLTHFIANTSTGLNEIPDLAAIEGKSFTFGSKGSTSGRLMPEYHIRKQFNRTPQSVFKRVGFSGDHSRTLALVQAGAYEVGALNYKVWDNAVKEGKVDPTKVRVIWTTPPYPDYQWTIRGDVNETFGANFTVKVRDALITMDDPELLEAFPRSAFIPARNADFQAIEDTARELKLLSD